MEVTILAEQASIKPHGAAVAVSLTLDTRDIIEAIGIEKLLDAIGPQEAADHFKFER